MPYLSTRDRSQPPERVAFDAVLRDGLAHDGGLYLPTEWPRLTAADLKSLRGKSYAEIAARVTAPFLDGIVAPAAWERMVADAYRGFDHQPDIAPLNSLGDGFWLMELFHGPTLAFKDYALQLVGRLFEQVLEQRRARVTIIGATSGDTGSAAIAGCSGAELVDIFMLYPKGRIAEAQRRQMTTVTAPNVHAIAVDGTFDDCQDLVKAMFADVPFRRDLNLSAVNSINWARIMAQIVYYVAAAIALGAPERSVGFTVPTGNFGNVFACHVARRMGVPISEIVVATNRNDILTRFFTTGTMSLGAVEASLSPSMDIQVASNFERFYYELKAGDAAAVADGVAAFRQSGTLPVSAAEWQAARTLFEAAKIDDAATLAEIAATHRATGVVLDPHSAIAVAAAKAKRRDPNLPMVALATAHPAKFPDAVARAIGRAPEMPARLAAVMHLPERAPSLPNDLAAIEDYVRTHARATLALGAAS
ncbi:MAG TPA: threonine synthase [Stellaceae bacterium]|nr:threonine synthase [Stellaceae bacterium]